MHCVSYAPFRAGQDPFGPDVPIDPRQIEDDLAQLKPITDCVRTYSIDHGLDQIPGNRQAPRPEGDAGAVAVEPCRT